VSYGAKNSIPTKRLTLTARETADALGISVATVLELARAQLLPSFKVGENHWFPVKRLTEIYPHIFRGDDAA